ncbi:HAD family hydrolase [Aureimonas glaciei]|uniref:phosphoglycolate phosphatase n=1 Tax=Aureimonas glaciei TaxID=1776957 RepID=A0A917DB57_9HYPH|nr:HAD family hydrolase [Aureimonas glaciei]GGD21413.1 phosphatase [Aureimonas glaciei]
MSPIAGILFDKDGTLLDFVATWGPATEAVIEALCDGDRESMADMAASAGFLPESLGFTEESPIIAGATDDFAPAWAARLGLAYDAAFAARVNALYRAHSLRSLVFYDDVAPVLASLAAQGIALGLATNDSERTARAHLAAMGVEASFGFVAGYDSGFGAKPGPGMVLAFADHLGVAPGAIALVGDSAHDMQAARAAGATAIGIARTDAASLALGTLPDAVVVGLDELHFWLSQRTAAAPSAV